MNVIGKLFLVVFILLKWTAIIIFSILAFFVNNFTKITNKGRTNIARRENDELRKMRLQKARNQRNIGPLE